MNTLLTRDQVCEILQISDTTLWRIMKTDKEFPSLKIGKLVRFDKDRLDYWLHQKQEGGNR